MDLGLKGKKAIVCAASKGLGRGCAVSLSRAGVDLVIVARTPGPLEQTASEIGEASGVTVTPVAADITTPEGRALALEACPEPDILVNNAGGPPPGNFRDWTRDDWIKAIDANMLTPIELIKATVDGMIARRFGRIVNITSSAVKAPIDILGLSNGARAGLTGFVAGIARRRCATTSRSTRCCPAPSRPTVCAPPSRACPRPAAGLSTRSGKRAPRATRPAASAIRRSSERPAPSSAASTPAISPARTC
jgi:3-oxoacyl-[acyl-carrier protein] reductase